MMILNFLFSLYEIGIPVLKGAGDNVLSTRGMVNLAGSHLCS